LEDFLIVSAFSVQVSLDEGIGENTIRRGLVKVGDIQYGRKHIERNVFIAVES
jgi:hypothetical protein